MAKADKLVQLEDAVEKQAANLDPAQREFVMAELETYKWNAARIEEIETQLEKGITDDEGNRQFVIEDKLYKRRHQLVGEQSSLFSHIMRWLKDTVAEEENQLMGFIRDGQ